MTVKKAGKFLRGNALTYLMVIAAYIIMVLLNDNKLLTRSMRGQLVPICVYIVMAISLNLTVGISGELSLGHAGFMSVGAFTGVIAAALFSGVEAEWLRLLLAMALGGVFAAIAGVIIGVPVLRLRGDYLAIVTLAFGEIIRNVINCLYVSMDGGALRVSFSDPNIPGKMLINGPQGALGIDKIATFGMGFALILFTLFVVLNLIDSRSGRAIMAIRDNRIAAESVGLSVTHYKLLAFIVSAALAGMAGALYAQNYSTVTAGKFKFDTSILVLVFVVLGGIGNIRGSVISAALLTVLPELLRSFDKYRMLVYAIVLILVMIATNNPFFKQLIRRCTALIFKPLTGRKKAKEGA